MLSLLFYLLYFSLFLFFLFHFVLILYFPRAVFLIFRLYNDDQISFVVLDFSRRYVTTSGCHGTVSLVTVAPVVVAAVVSIAVFY